ncbi:hypothetical protein K435DRAFT_246068 [Dendrothele bispora CBS 962.96]|uniref:Uncharacterized protein n=1 Tax=Dendrothele bispora (strain CBS 962.96) TaxID=1314807 RepID=A0A4S8LNN7_DENBC|nr:hypothetical protein K435DRAFT_246068 [Dendrothele bispora CBS 962.96]
MIILEKSDAAVEKPGLSKPPLVDTHRLPSIPQSQKDRYQVQDHFSLHLFLLCLFSSFSSAISSSSSSSPASIRIQIVQNAHHCKRLLGFTSQSGAFPSHLFVKSFNFSLPTIHRIRYPTQRLMEDASNKPLFSPKCK